MCNGMLDVNFRHQGYNTLLHQAVKREHIDVIKLLLEKGADPNIPHGWGLTPFHIAASDGHDDVFQILLDGGGDPNMPTWQGFTPLHFAVTIKSKARIEQLLQRGADINEKIKDGLTALHLAAKRGFNDLALFLLDNGAVPTEITKKDDYWNGHTPASIAHRYGHVDTAKILMNYNPK